MSVAHAPPTHVQRMHVNPWLVAVIALMAALVGLAAWVAVDRFAGGGGATHDATTLIDRWQAASTARDGQALTALLTKDAVQWADGSTLSGSTAIVDAVTSTPGLRVERIAPVTVEGDFASTFASVTAAGVTNQPVVEIYQLQNGKIFRQWVFGLGRTAPFDNTATP